MDYETEIIDGHKAVVRHFFKPHEIQVGSRWGRRDGGSYVAIIENVEELISTDGTTCRDVYYSIYDSENVKYKDRMMWDKWFLSHYYPLENDK